MKKIVLIAATLLAGYGISQDFSITDVHVKKDEQLQQLVFTIQVAGLAGDSIPSAIGGLDGAPVLGYVFPTTLNSEDVGFGSTDGIVALALTSHPDFDDTPLWDENLDFDYLNDGVVWHPHWVILEDNPDVPGGLAVKATDEFSELPPTNPGMPMYMDSPGFPVLWEGNEIHCTVPLYRVNNRDDFNYDGVTAYMEVNTSDPDLPMLGVYDVYGVASGDLSLPYSIGTHSCDTLFVDLSTGGGIGLIDPVTVQLYPNPALTEFTIAAPAELDLDQFEIKIYTTMGELVFERDLDEPLTSVNTADLGAAGTYLIHFIDKVTSETRGTRKIVVSE